MCESEVKMQTKEKLTSSELVGKTGKWQKMEEDMTKLHTLYDVCTEILHNVGI